MPRKRVFTDRSGGGDAFLGPRRRPSAFSGETRRPAQAGAEDEAGSRPASTGRKPPAEPRVERRVRKKKPGSAKVFDGAVTRRTPPVMADEERKSSRRRPAGVAELEGASRRRPPPVLPEVEKRTPRVRRRAPGSKRRGRASGGRSASPGARPHRRLNYGRLLLLAGAAVAVGLVIWFFAWAFRSPVGGLSPAPGSLTNMQEAVEVDFRKSVKPDAFTLTVGGRDVTDEASLKGNTLTCRVDLPDGEHEAEIEVRQGGLMGARSRKWSFTVDSVPPTLAITERSVREIEGSTDVEVEFSGEVSKNATVRAGDEIISVDSEGGFSGKGVSSRLRSFEITATDEAGNVARSSVVTQKPPVARGIHVSVYITSSESALGRMIDLVERTELNCLQIDIKDEAGQIGSELDNELAEEVGSAKEYFRLDPVVDRLRHRDIFTIARIVVFKDPVLARGRPELAVKGGGGGGGPWSDGSWVDPYSREVWDYNIAVAEAAARAGFHEIQFDYIRFPSDGDTTTAVYPARDDRNPGEVIDGFISYARERLAPYNVFVSTDLFGLVASDQGEMGIGQRVAAIAEQVDYISPMVYPSHYNPGEYGIGDPESNPYDIVSNSLKDFKKVMEGTPAKLRPWLQDFSLRVTYTPDMVRRQIQACYDEGVEEWLLWDPDCRYSEGALKPASD